MDIWTIFWFIVIFGVALTVGQFIFGILLYAVIGFFALITLPFTWAYEKIKGNK